MLGPHLVQESADLLRDHLVAFRTGIVGDDEGVDIIGVAEKVYSYFHGLRGGSLAAVPVSGAGGAYGGSR